MGVDKRGDVMRLRQETIPRPLVKKEVSIV